MLFSLHFMAANVFHESALQLEEKESEQFAKAIMEASAAWGHPELSDKALATLNLCGTMLVVYGPRAVVIARRQRSPKPPPIASPAGNVYGDAGRATEQAAAAVPPKAAAASPIARPNGGVVQTATSPFGDQDGTLI